MFFFINNEILATYLDISSDFIISFIVKETTLRYTQSCEISYIDTFYEVKTLWKVFLFYLETLMFHFRNKKFLRLIQIFPSTLYYSDS